MVVRRANRANDAKLPWHRDIRRATNKGSGFSYFPHKGKRRRGRSRSSSRLSRFFRGRQSLNIQRFRDGGISNESQRRKEGEREREREREREGGKEKDSPREETLGLGIPGPKG